jgi:hypothetical protein
MDSQLQILWHRVSTYSRSYLKRINLENDRMKNKENKRPSTKLLNNR